MGLGPVGLIHQYVRIENMQGNDTINLIIRSPSILRIKLLLSAFNCKFQICKEHKEKKIPYSHTGYDQITLKLWKWVENELIKLCWSCNHLNQYFSMISKWFSSWLTLVLLSIFTPLTFLNMMFLFMNVNCRPICSFIIPTD